MTPEDLRALISAGETLSVEFKGEEHESLNDRDLVEAVICLANRPVGGEAGYLLIGVEDDDRLTGARPRHETGTTDPRRVEALIAGRTRPAMTCRVEMVSLDGRDVLVIKVPASRAPAGTTDGKYLRRAIGGRGRPECLPFHFHEMQAHQASRGILDYSALVVPEARWEDLDPLEFERLRRSIRESRGLGDSTLLDLPDRELAKALGAVEANHEIAAVRVLGLLLFGKEEALRSILPTHEVAFQKLSGTQVEVNDFFRWPLLRAMDELLSRFRARNREEELMIGFLRVGVPDYPERAFREAVANALIHRDYTRLGAVHVQQLSPLCPHLPAAGRESRLRLPARLRTFTTGTDGAPVRCQTWTHNAPRGGCALPGWTVPGHAAPQAAGERGKTRDARHRQGGLVRTALVNTCALVNLRARS